MDKIKIGIISPSNIAFNRFLPSLMKSVNFEYAGLAIANSDEWFNPENENISQKLLSDEKEKAEKFVDKFGGKIFYGYKELLNDSNIDAVYIPLPPNLHFKWAKEALLCGKHVLVEKPSTDSYEKSSELVELADMKGLALHENYMFTFHEQLNEIMKRMKECEFGEIRGYKLSFGFPRRSPDDFRYKKNLGGGALLDCGGYPIKLAAILLGDTAEIVYSKLNYTTEFDVDLFGSVIMKNSAGITAFISFGMDNAYQCQLEAWGSKETIIAPRIFTAGVDVEPTLIIKSSNDENNYLLNADDQFLHSIDYFYECVVNKEIRKNNYNQIKRQAGFISQVANYKEM